MPQCAMKRLAILPILSLSCVCLSSTAEEILTKRYRDYNTSILKGDSKRMETWLKSFCDSKLTYTSFHKNKFGRDNYISGVLAQIAKTNQVLKSTTTVRSFKKTSDSIVATVASDFKGVVVFDSRKLTLTDQSVTFETWIRAGRDWKLQKIVQVNADTQMKQDGED